MMLELLLLVTNPPKRTPAAADKGYCSEANDKILRKLKLTNQIQKKAKRNKPLIAYLLRKNEEISKIRYVGERTCGGQKAWFGGGGTRHVGLARTHTQHVLEAICYNLKRAPRIFAELQVQA